MASSDDAVTETNFQPPHLCHGRKVCARPKQGHREPGSRMGHQDGAGQDGPVQHQNFVGGQRVGGARHAALAGTASAAELATRFGICAGRHDSYSPNLSNAR